MERIWLWWASDLLELESHKFVLLSKLFNFTNITNGTFEPGILFFKLKKLLMKIMRTALSLQVKDLFKVLNFFL